MKKWLPYIIAAVIGLGVAVLAFGPGMSTPTKKARGERHKKVAEQVTAPMEGEEQGLSRSRDGEPKEVEVGKEIPPDGTLRPLNKSEIEQNAKLERPLNKHFAYVNAYWNRATQLAGPGGSEISRECAAMARYLRDQSNLSDSALDSNAVISKELELVGKVRQTAPPSEELTAVLDYIQASAEAVRDGGDPTTVPKPPH
jgi:hypothetical protein